jgi:hypothetical protein
MAGLLGGARTRKLLGGPVNILTTDLVTGNQVAALIAPAGFMLGGLLGSVPDLDTGAALTISLGDAANNARFVNASIVGQAGGAWPALVAGATFYVFPADTEVLITFPAGPAGATAGTIVLYLDGWVGNP